jgi:hypothetical protein
VAVYSEPDRFRGRHLELARALGGLPGIAELRPLDANAGAGAAALAAAVRRGAEAVPT